MITDDQLDELINAYQRTLARLSQAGDTARVVRLVDAGMLHMEHALLLLRQHGNGVNFLANCDLPTSLRLRHLAERLKTAFWV